jgi:hypothetical protein
LTADELWRGSNPSPGTIVRVAHDAAAWSLELDEARGFAAGQSGQILAALVVVAVAAVALVARRRRWPLDEAVRWPHGLAVAAGLFWWLFLVPGFVGWLIIGVSLAAALPGGRWLLPPPAPSSVLRARPGAT